MFSNRGRGDRKRTNVWSTSTLASFEGPGRGVIRRLEELIRGIGKKDRIRRKEGAGISSLKRAGATLYWAETKRNDGVTDSNCGGRTTESKKGNSSSAPANLPRLNRQENSAGKVRGRPAEGESRGYRL